MDKTPMKPDSNDKAAPTLHDELAEALKEVRDIFKKHLDGKLSGEDSQQANRTFALLNNISSMLRDKSPVVPSTEAGQTATFDEDADFPNIYAEAQWLMTERLFPADEYGENSDCERLWNIIEEAGRREDQLSKELQETRAALVKMTGLVQRLTPELKFLIEGESDDPSVGIVGWNASHDLVAEAEAALASSTSKEVEP